MVEANQHVDIDEGVIFTSVAGRELIADIYRPTISGPARPGILMVHGGGWRFGEPAMMRGYCILMARHGYPCMASEYRFTGEAPWPAQIDDVQAAISWLRENGAQFGVNPGQIVLWGGSAGGHLILQAAAEISNAQGKSSPIAATVSYYPITSLEPSLGDAWEDAQALLPGADADQLRSMSPLALAGPSFPPTLLLHGANDETVVADQSQQLYNALNAAGVPTELHLYAGQPHGFDLDRTFARHSIDVARLFLSRYAPLPADAV